MEKKINYLSRTFADIKDELIKFSNQYYPEVADDFTDSSIGAWFIDLVSAVGDDLSYHTDRMYQETNINSANLRSTLLNLARTNGVKVPGAKCSMCEVELSCVLPIDGDSSATDGSIAEPNWNYAPIVLRTSLFSAGNTNFELTEDVNFAEQFNSDGYSNRKIIPARDSNGSVTGYTISKSTIAINGTTKVYKKVLTSADIKPFMEVVLPETNVTNVESIIFKETSDITKSPEIYEYYIDAEEYRLSKDAVMTYRYFETDSLADQYRFGMIADIPSGKEIANIYNPHKYDDYTELTKKGTARTTRYYRGEWKSLTQKFITEFTDNGYLKIIFGSSNGYGAVPDAQTTYADYIASNLINNDMLGVLPKEGWSMYVLYRVGGGAITNLGPGSINTISSADIDWGGQTGNTSGSERGKVLNSLAITNISTALAGKDTPSNEEIKYLIKYNTSAQNRVVTVKDYKVKLMQMPPKFGAPFRNTVIEANNKIEMSFLGLDADGQLDSALPQTLVSNVVEYMSNYRQINDYIEVKSGRIYNIGVEVDLFIDKNYNTADVIGNVIGAVKEYFAVENHDMGDDIFVGDLEKQIALTDGVISLINLRIFKIWNGGYSPDKCPLPTLVEGSVCDTSQATTFKIEGANVEQIDLDQIDMVLYGDYNSMYEIKNPKSDIQCRAKLR
jgi:hypothetical protein